MVLPPPPAPLPEKLALSSELEPQPELELSAEALLQTIGWTVHTYRDLPAHFRSMQQRAMQKPLGWSHAARQYEALYRMSVLRRRAR